MLLFGSGAELTEGMIATLDMSAASTLPFRPRCGGDILQSKKLFESPPRLLNSKGLAWVYLVRVDRHSLEVMAKHYLQVHSPALVGYCLKIPAESVGVLQNSSSRFSLSL